MRVLRSMSSSTTLTRRHLRSWRSLFRKASARSLRRSCFSCGFAPMNTDCFFNIGATHSVCQDYVVASPYLILSDGCSSSPDTDIGARLLVKAAERVCGKYEIEEVHKESARLALGWAKLL